MLPVIIGAIVTGVILAASKGEKVAPADGVKPAAKAPKAARKLSAQESFLEGKKAAAAELAAEAAKKTAEDAAIEAEVAKRIKAREASAPKTETPPAGGDGAKT